MYRFKVGDAVTVKPNGKTKGDPGGRGTVTARQHREVGGKDAETSYRIDIPGNPAHEKSREKKGKEFRGFWYPEDQLG
jgi:hypothetical protein